MPQSFVTQLNRATKPRYQSVSFCVMLRVPYQALSLSCRQGTNARGWGWWPGVAVSSRPLGRPQTLDKTLPVPVEYKWTFDVACRSDPATHRHAHVIHAVVTTSQLVVISVYMSCCVVPVGDRLEAGETVSTRVFTFAECQNHGICSVSM